MGINIYNPLVQKWENYNPGPNGDPYMKEKALINILIEMRVQTEYLAAQNRGIVTDDTQTLRNDVVSDFPIA